jgi:hypothetical protein
VDPDPALQVDADPDPALVPDPGALSPQNCKILLVISSYFFHQKLLYIYPYASTKDVPKLQEQPSAFKKGHPE